MPLLPETLNVNYQKLPFVEPENEAAILHYAAKIDSLPKFLPFPLSQSKEKTEFLQQLKTLAQKLSSTYKGNASIRLFKLIMMPPERIIAKKLKIPKRPLTIAEYDVAFMCICNNSNIAEKIQNDPTLQTIRKMSTDRKQHDIAIAKIFAKQVKPMHIANLNKICTYLITSMLKMPNLISPPFGITPVAGLWNTLV